MERAAGTSPDNPMMSLGWVTLAVVVVIGIFSLLSLWLGFQAYGSDNPDQAIYYIVIGAAGIAAIGYMFFRTKAVSSTKKPDVPEVEVVTILECPSCDLKRVRDFKRGDYVYKDDEPCTRCEGTMVITGIHKRAEPKKAKR
ncbi:MAG: hypothetical protein PVJ38_06035 [Candidatus Bathyarchaeota archaeon]